MFRARSPQGYDRGFSGVTCSRALKGEVQEETSHMQNLRGDGGSPAREAHCSMPPLGWSWAPGSQAPRPAGRPPTLGGAPQQAGPDAEETWPSVSAPFTPDHNWLDQVSQRHEGWAPKPSGNASHHRPTSQLASLGRSHTLLYSKAHLCPSPSLPVLTSPLH